MIKPDYRGGSIVNLMSSLRLGLGDSASPYPAAHALPADRVVRAGRIMLLVLDGLGDNLLASSTAGATFRRYRRSRLTSVFPSTTATAVTTILTGEAPQQHALTGWFTYFRELDDVVTVLPFLRRRINDGSRDVAMTPRELYGHTPLFDRLRVSCHSIMPAYIAHSAFNVDHNGCAELHAFEDLDSLFTTAEQTLRNDSGPLFVHAYWPGIDALSHEHGPSSDAVSEHLNLLDKTFADFLRRVDGSDALILVCADHGLIDTDEHETVHLEDHPALAELLSQPLCGEPRSAFCYVQPQREKSFLQYLETHLDRFLEVFPSTQLIEQGWFGSGPAHPGLADRVGTYTLIMKNRFTVRDRLPGERLVHQSGVHGGVSEDEMYIPLVVAQV